MGRVVCSDGDCLVPTAWNDAFFCDLGALVAVAPDRFIFEKMGAVLVRRTRLWTESHPLVTLESASVVLPGARTEPVSLAHSRRHLRQ